MPETITDLLTLRQQVVDWSHADETFNKWDSVLQLAEARLSRDIQSRRIEMSIYGDLTDPVLPIPEDVLALQRIIIYKDGNREASIEKAPPGVNEKLTGYVGVPKSFAIIDQSIIIYPTPDRVYEYALYYIPRLRPLTTENPTNTVLLDAPDAYMYACQAEFCVFNKDWEGNARYLALYDMAWKNYQSAVDRMKYPLKTPMRIRMRSPVH